MFSNHRLSILIQQRRNIKQNIYSWKTDYESIDIDMDARSGAAATENTNTFEPSSDLIHEDACDTLLLYLPGFTKDQLRVQLSKSGALRISGSRPLGENQRSSFLKEFQVSPNCDTDKISAKFEGGILYIRQPKVIVPAEEKPQKTPTPQITPQPQKSDRAEEKPTAVDDKKKQTTDDSHKEPEAKAEEKSRESEVAKKDEEKRKKDEENRKRDEEKHKKDEEKKATTSYKRDPVASAAGGDYKVKTEKLKLARKITMVAAVLLAFAVGMYVRKYMAGFGKKAES